MMMTTTTTMNDVEMKDYVQYSDLEEEPLVSLPPITAYEQMPLVTLGEALESLVSIVPDIKQMLEQIKKNSTEIQDDLTRDESDSIRLYTMSWEPKEQSFSLLLNRTLRNDNREKLKPWHLYLKLFFKALSKLPSKHCYVYRGIGTDLTQEYSQGKIFLWYGFALCTQSIEKFETEQKLLGTDQRTRFKIECKSAKDIRNHTYQKLNENILLLSSQRYKVTSIIDSSQGLHIIQIKEIDASLSSTNRDHAASISLPITPVKPSVNISIQNTSFCSVVLKLTGSVSSVYHNPQLEDLLCLSKMNSPINLYARELNDQDMSIIVQRAIIDKKCKCLYLTGNQISNQGVSILADGLYNNFNLIELDLSDNYLTDFGVQFLMEILITNQTILQKLHLGSNNITDIGIEHISNMLKTNQTITHLFLNRIHMTNHGVHLLANSLGLINKTLQVLSLSANGLINDSSVDSLIDMLQQNQTLKGLDLKYCQFTEDNRHRLKQIAHEKQGFKLLTTKKDKQCFVS